MRCYIFIVLLTLLFGISCEAEELFSIHDRIPIQSISNHNYQFDFYTSQNGKMKIDLDNNEKIEIEIPANQDFYLQQLALDLKNGLPAHIKIDDQGTKQVPYYYAYIENGKSIDYYHVNISRFSLNENLYNFSVMVSGYNSLIPEPTTFYLSILASLGLLLIRNR